MFSKTISKNQAREQQRALIAAGIAIVLHFVVLLSSPFSSDFKDWSQKAERSISIQLSKPIIPEPVEPITPIPVVGTEIKPNVAPLISQKSLDQETEEKIEVVTVLTPTTLKNWTKLETDKLLRNDPRALSEFGATFIEPKVIAEPKQTSFISGYGDTHVVSKVGDKQVCYMQSQEHPQDDWSKGVVMFYKCPPKDKFTLEIP